MGVSAAGSDIKVAIFDDMLEITSPGALPDSITPEVSPLVRLVSALEGEMSRQEIMQWLNLKDEEHFRRVYLAPALKAGLVERTIPTKPRSSKQQAASSDTGSRRRDEKAASERHQSLLRGEYPRNVFPVPDERIEEIAQDP